jgi:MFS family permease
VIGYGIATVARPFTALAQTATQVLAIRVTDRVGKGIRSSPRDALLADSTDSESRGRAFGFHAAMDNAGAVLGPLVAFLLLRQFHFTLRNVFWMAAIPGALAFIVLVIAVKEVEHRPADPRAQTIDTSVRLGSRFWYYLAIVFLFTLGNSTDAFLLLRSNQLGVAVALAPILWAFFNGVKAAFGTWGGSLSDRFARKPLIIAGWTVYALVYLGFAFATSEWHAWALFAAYALFYAFTEGTEKAFVADLIPRERRGSAYGWFNLAIGLGALPASLIFGAIWDRVGPHAAFLFGASLAMLASFGMLFVRSSTAASSQTT